MLSERSMLSAAPPGPTPSLRGCGGPAPSAMLVPSTHHQPPAFLRVDQPVACEEPSRSSTALQPQQQPHSSQQTQTQQQQQQQQSTLQFPLSALPNELVCLVLRSCALTSRDLAKVCVASKQLRNLAHVAADDKLQCLLREAREVKRWRYPSLNRLLIEETLSGFSWDPETRDPADFMLETTQTGTHIRLDGPGPKMLVSMDSTSTSKLLRWRFKLEGNNAVEFGVVPVCLLHDSKALHKCNACKCNESPDSTNNSRSSSRSSSSYGSVSTATGFCSNITVGSNLPVKLPLMKGSDIEILVWSGPEMDASKPKRVEFIIKQPEKNAIEMVWQNQTTVPKPYKGPQHLRFEVELAGDESYKLALTCWAKAHLISAAPPAWQ